MLRPAESIERLMRSPVGHYVAGHSYLAWIASPTLLGMANFGQRTEQDSNEVLRCFGVLNHPDLRPPVAVLLDYRRLEGMTPESYAKMALFMRESFSGLMTRLEKLVLLVPPTQVGAVVAGMVSMMGYTLPARILGTEDEALAVLGHHEAQPVLEQVEALVADRNGVLDVLNTVRAYLRKEPANATLERAAQRARVSARTLQRELSNARTTFRQEQHAARAAAAAHLLEETEDKIEAIARAVGCSSSSQLSALFRRVYQTTPADFREHRRPG